MDSGPNSVAELRNLVATVSSASSQEIRSNAWVGPPFLSGRGPFGATRLRGYNTRSGEYTRSRYFATLAHRNPRVIGCVGSPWILVARPSSTVIKTPQASGQSCGQAAWTTLFTMLHYSVVFLGICRGRDWVRSPLLLF